MAVPQTPHTMLPIILPAATVHIVYYFLYLIASVGPPKITRSHSIVFDFLINNIRDQLDVVTVVTRIFITLPSPVPSILQKSVNIITVIVVYCFFAFQLILA